MTVQTHPAATLTNALLGLSLLANCGGGVAALSVWMSQNNVTQSRVSDDLPNRITSLQHEMATKIQDLTTANSNQFTAIAAAIASIPNINASLPQLTDRVSRIEQRNDFISTKLDAVQQKSIETEAQLKAALQAGVASQRVPR